MAKSSSPSSLLMCALIALLLWCSSAISEGPFIVAHKKVALKSHTQTQTVSVSIDIFNQGSATAYDVSINDASWPEDLFRIVTGNTSRSWERLDVGAVLSHSFELEANLKTVFNGAPAVITFRIPTKAALQEAYSTPIFPLDISADSLSEKKFDFAKRLLAKYGSLVSVVSFVSLFVYLVATPKSSAAKGSKKKQ